MAKLATGPKALSGVANKLSTGTNLTLADAGHYDSALVKLKQLNSGAPDRANLPKPISINWRAA